MSNKKYIIILLMILCLSAISSVSANDLNDNMTLAEDNGIDNSGLIAVEDVNQTIYDDTNDLVSGEDTLSVSLSEDELSAKDDGTFTALQKKIDNAPYGSTITLENDYKYDEGFTSDGIKISGDKKLTIDGNGHTIDALESSRIFHVVSEDGAELKNIVFVNGRMNEFKKGGGAIQANYDLIIDNCTFSNCVASNAGYGGAIEAGSLIVRDSIFNNNKVYMGRISSGDVGYGGAIYCRVELTIDNSIFQDNYAENLYGAIRTPDLNMNSCVFINNKARDIGVMGYRVGYIDSSIFINNYGSSRSVTGGVGGLVDDYYTRITNSIFLNNDNYVIDCCDNYIYSCWFGNTIDNYQDQPKVNPGGYRALDNWLVLNVSANPSKIKYGEKSSVVFTLNNLYDASSGVIRHVDDSNLPDFYLNLSATNGNLNKKSVLYDENVIVSSTNGKDIVVTADYGPTYSITIPVESSTVLDVPDVTKNYGGSERLEVTLTEGGSPVANADVNININGADYTRTTDANGKASLGLNLNAGSYDATVTYKDISTKAKVVINKLTTKNTLSYAKNSHNSVTLTALIDPSTASGDVVFTVNGKDYSAKVNGGKATYTLNNLAVGSYSAVAKYKGDVNHKESSSNSVKFTVEDVKIEVSAPDLTKYYNGPERFVVTVKEDNKPVVGKAVTINLNGVPYTRTTDANGRCSMAINLNSGKYKITTEYDGIKVYSTVTIKDTVISKDFTKIFRNDTQYYATFVDSQGNVLKNTQVRLNINGVYYTRTTSDQGIAKMNINLNPGTYVLTAENPASGEQHTTVIKVLSSIVENHDLIKYYRNESKYTLRILDGNGKPVGAGVTVKLNINGVFYERKTNASGYMNMNINLNPGTYIVTAEYNGLMASNTVKVLPILSAKDVNMKYRDGTKFELKLLDGKGNPFAAQKITFNINGVFYERITDSNGIARLNLNLQASQYIITSMYENGAALANKVTIIS